MIVAFIIAVIVSIVLGVKLNNNRGLVKDQKSEIKSWILTKNNLNTRLDNEKKQSNQLAASVVKLEKEVKLLKQKPILDKPNIQKIVKKEIGLKDNIVKKPRPKKIYKKKNIVEKK